MAEYIVAHDVGTSGSKAVLVDTTGRIVGKSYAPYRVLYPKPDWAEQDPDDWWHAVATTTRALLDQTSANPKDIVCVVYGTQMLGIVPMAPTGDPTRHGIIWLDNRACTQACRAMRKFGGPRMFSTIAGATLCGKDGIPKLLWLKEEEPTIYENMCCFLDVAGYLNYRSTGNMAMDWSNASVFGLDLKKKEWLKGVFRYVGLDPAKFPPLVRSIDSVGAFTREAASQCGLLEGTPVIAGAGDAPAAAVGSGAVGEGEGHVYLGTSGWVGVVTSRMPKGKCGVASVHSADPDKAFLFAESETAGACLQWVADEFYKEEQQNPQVSNIFALMDQKLGDVPPGSDYVIFTPWMYGERAPVNDCYVRSCFLNVSAEHSRENLMRAAYEGVAYNIRWIVDIVEKRFNFPLPVLRVIGGGARSEPWMRVLADVTQKKVETVCDPQEAGAVGIALVAAVGLGIYPDFESLKGVVKVDKTLQPDEANRDIYDFLFGSYKQLYSDLRGLYCKLNTRRSREATGTLAKA
ncbi:MAG: FGGY-family carbohydrate kinase [Chloroflexota bacterium]|nr:FGGY-family carbohydrate kinase [Chloroflexota bacterium]